MKAIASRIRTLLSGDRGQDLVEFALLAGFIAVAAGGFLPSAADSISIIFSRVGSLTSKVANPGQP